MSSAEVWTDGRVMAQSVLTEDLWMRVVKVETYVGQAKATNASGFFFLQNSYLYLITNRHVVRDEQANHRPDSLLLTLHTNPQDLTQNETLRVPLYLDDAPLWKEHPTHGADVDVVAVPINDVQVLSTYHIAAFSNLDVLSPTETLPPGQSVLIVGFPLGFHDSLHNLPLIRQATVASDFSHPFKGQPYFLTDARMHRGTSGAPVVARLKRATSVAGSFEDHWCLLGVHSASLDVSDRDPDQDDRLGLNTAWYATLLIETIGAALPQDTVAQSA